MVKICSYMKNYYIRFYCFLLICCCWISISYVQDEVVKIDSIKVIKKDKIKNLFFEVGCSMQLKIFEGIWMLVDVSFDGKIIVFDLFGDIYLLLIEGGKV